MQHRNHFEQLKKVRMVDAPPFLLTRIHAKIRSKQAERLPVSWAWAASLAIGLLLVLNSLALLRLAVTTPAESLADQLQINQTQQLYADSN